jgi:alkylation response protein AidB-like acyl-CoA dehydrogenase
MTKIDVQPRDATDAAEILAAARALVPWLREQAAQCEADRRVSDAAIAKLREARLFDVVKPRRYGGLELGWDAFCEAVVAIASGCGSTGWVYSVVGGHAAVIARFGTDFMDEMWGAKPNALMSSCRCGEGGIAPVPGGYRGSGIGRFSSGVLNADWVIMEDTPVNGRDGSVTVVMPVAGIEVLDTWHAVGLAGTGSHDIRFSDLFIPEHRCWFPGKAPHGEKLEGPLFRTPFLGGPFALPSVLLGIALGGLEHFVDATNWRVSRRDGKLADLQTMQLRIGQSAVELDAALALLRVQLVETMARLSAGAAPPDPLRPAVGSHPYDTTVSGYVAHTAYRALERLMAAAGAGQLALSEPFQRCFRDVLAGLQQPSNNWDRGRVAGGRDLLDRARSAR